MYIVHLFFQNLFCKKSHFFKVQCYFNQILIDGVNFLLNVINVHKNNQHLHMIPKMIEFEALIY